MKKQSAEDYLDKLLNSVNGEFYTEDEQDMLSGDEDSIVEAVAVQESQPEMVTRRVSRSEEEFLKEFEAELEQDDFDDFLRGFDEEKDMDGMEVSFDGNDFVFAGEKTDATPVSVFDAFSDEEEAYEQPQEDVYQVENENLSETDAFPFEDLFGSAEDTEEPMNLFEAEEPASSEPITDSFDLGGVDLGGLLNEAMGESVPAEETADMSSDDDLLAMLGGEISTSSMETASNDAPVDDMFANLFGDDSVGEAGDISNLDSLFSSNGDASGAIDLGNLGEADLMSLLSGDGELSDLGDMLSQGESTDVSFDGLDAFAAFAEGEMAGQATAEAEEEVVTKKKAKKGGKGGFLDKIKEILLSDDDDEVELKSSSSPSAGQLSGENAEILAEMDAEDKGASAKGGFFAKLKKGKGADEKEGKKEKKEKKPKKEKPKKEKKPKEIDNTPPLPKGPVLLIWLMVFSLVGLVYLTTNLVSYSSHVSEAKAYYNTGNYAEAYQELLGLTLKEKDMALYNQVATLATVDSELNAYKVFLENERYTEALDSLVCAAGRCELNEDSAEVYECLGQMEILRKAVSNALNEYEMTYEQALEMYHLKDREDYTIALYTKLKELGLE